MRAALLLTLLFAFQSAWPAGLDLHRYWDDRCFECHGHAGDFAREHLRLIDGELVGSQPERDLKDFLRNHYPADTEVPDLYAMLRSQVATQALFKAQCVQCHGSAVALVRSGVERRDNALVARSSGRPLGDFLIGHAGLAEDGAAFYLGILARIHGEVNR